MKVRMTFVATTLALCVVVGAADSAERPFDGRRAMDLLEWQCSLGARTPGSAAHRTFRDAVHTMADSLGLKLAEDRFTAVTPLDGVEREFVNIVISTGPASGPRLWFGAHYDCRIFADHDPDPAARRLPVPGANDGASGTAVLLHLAEIMAAEPPPVGVDLILFDGEDQGVSGAPRSFCLGSDHLAATFGDFTNPLGPDLPLGMVLVDMIGETGVEIPMEPTSLRYAPQWTNSVFDRAAELGLDAFVPAPGRPVHDDHVPFLLIGVQAVDLIDFQYDVWHTVADTPDACSAESLGQVGTLLLDLARRPPGEGS